MGEKAAGMKLCIVCTKCGDTLPPLAHVCPRCPDALPRAEYAEKRFVLQDRGDIFRFAAWLPAEATVETTIGPTVFRSEQLAETLGLTELSVAFSGYAPEVTARNVTGTFKDFEALPTLLYLREHGATGVVLASAGNTARAFAYAAGVLGFPTTIVVPEAAAASVWVPARPTEDVRLIVLAKSTDYAAAIRLAGAIAARYGIHPEGGARNVARRDGMGTTILEYARIERRLPRHYVQAVGSGTGAIAAWEAALRLQATGEFGDPAPRLHLAQNVPFTPIHDAWTAGEEIEPERDVEGQLRRIAAIAAPVLANRTPPFALEGGVRAALRATGGHTYAVTNSEIETAQRLFEEREGLRIGPESGAALAALCQGLARGWIDRAESVLLHVTGNGDAVLRRDVALRPVPVWRRVPPERDAALRVLDRAFAR
ncbi:MAG: cysteate synthase [Candidatus Bipolaricaulota bacterium]|nr:cysteate synthase [Candidatus Bipolaricaulota bacterium]